MSGEGKAVYVTGASGYIASWLVKMFLESGYTVKATVRKLARASRSNSKTRHRQKTEAGRKF